MEENKEISKSLSFSEIMRIIRTRLVWIILIMVFCLAVGISFVVLVQKTTYSATIGVCVQANNYMEKNENGEYVEVEVPEHTKYQYSALLASEYQKVLTSNEIINEISKSGVVINVDSLKFTYTESSAFFTITYSYKTRTSEPEIVKNQVAETLNKYIDASIEVIDKEDSKFPVYLKDKLMVYSRALDVAESKGSAVTILLSLVIGALLSMIFVVAMYFIDDTINTKEDVERIAGVSNLAFIDISVNETFESSPPTAVANKESNDKGGK